MVSSALRLKSRLPVLGAVLVAVFAIAAVSAGAAQASPHWTVEGKEFTGTEALSESIQLEKVGTETTPKVSVKFAPGGLVEGFSCTGLRQVGGKISETSRGSISGLSFTGCVIPEAEKSCRIKNGGGTPGIINTHGVTAELKTVGNTTYLLLNPTEPILINLVIEKQPEKSCAVSGEYQITGSIGLQVETNTNATYLKAESSSAIQNASGGTLAFGSHPGYMTGKLSLSLASGKSWGVGL